MRYKIVIDTNVFISALKSKHGASNKLFSLIGKSEKFTVNISVPLIFEYEYAAKKLKVAEFEDIDDIIQYICRVCNECKTHYLYRPILRDPKDDFILELAYWSKSNFIITYNKKDFAGAEDYGIKLLNPKEFLLKTGDIK